MFSNYLRNMCTRNDKNGAGGHTAWWQGSASSWNGTSSTRERGIQNKYNYKHSYRPDITFSASCDYRLNRDASY